jgi:hypothetical protein
MTDWRLFEDEHRALIAVAEACWRPHQPSYSWHVLDWLCWRQRCKYPVLRRSDMALNMEWTGT